MVLSEMDIGKLVQKRKWNCPSKDGGGDIWALPKFCPSDGARRGRLGTTKVLTIRQC